MQFCPKCGAILILKTKNYGCPRCDYSTKEKIKLISSEKPKEEKEIAVIKEKDSETNPIVKEECPKCKNTKAYFWTMQTRSSDEAETKFFKCTKCGHIRRDYK
jgi:transcription factor S